MVNLSHALELHLHRSPVAARPFYLRERDETMKKSELIESIAEKAQTSKAAAARVVDAIFDASSGAIAEAVQAGRQVSIPGFGKFRPRQRPARKGRNPRTGQEIDIPAGTVVSFSPAKGLKDSLAGKSATSPKRRAGAGARAAKPATGAASKAAGASSAKKGTTKR